MVYRQRPDDGIFQLVLAMHPTPLVLPDRATQVGRITILNGIVWQAQQWLSNALDNARKVITACRSHIIRVTHPRTNEGRHCLTLVLRP